MWDTALNFFAQAFSLRHQITWIAYWNRLFSIPLQCVRTVLQRPDWGPSYHTFIVFLSILTKEKHYGRLILSPVHLHSGYFVLYWLPRSPSLKESIKPWDLTAVGLFLLSPTAVKLQGGYHRGATLWPEFLLYTKRNPGPSRTNLVPLARRSLERRQSAGVTIYKHCLQTIFTNTTRWSQLKEISVKLR